MSLSKLEIENLNHFFKKSFVEKKQFIVQPGFINKHRTYIAKGTFRGSVVDNEGQEHTNSFAMDYTSTMASIVLFLGFGIARLIGFAIDGNPGESFIQGIIFEFVLGLLRVFAFFKYREINNRL